MTIPELQAIAKLINATKEALNLLEYFNDPGEDAMILRQLGIVRNELVSAGDCVVDSL